MAWNEKGTALAVLKGKEKKGFLHKENVLVAVTGVGGENAAKTEYDPSSVFDFPKDFVISEKGAVIWTEDLNKIFFGIKEQEPKPEDKKSEDEKETTEELADVDICHWNDERIESVQMASAERDKNFTYMGALILNSKKFHQLTDKKMRAVDLSRDGKWGIGKDNSKYWSDWPELKASHNFLELQKELANTEDRIQTSRRFYNGNVRDLNTRTEIFPSNIIASLFQFRRSEYFEIEEIKVSENPSILL